MFLSHLLPSEPICDDAWQGAKNHFRSTQHKKAMKHICIFSFLASVVLLISCTAKTESLFADVSAEDSVKYAAIFKSLNLIEHNSGAKSFMPIDYQLALEEISAYTDQYFEKKESGPNAEAPLPEAVLWRLNQASPTSIAIGASEQVRYDALCNLISLTTNGYGDTQAQMNFTAGSHLLLYEYLIMYYQNRLLTFDISPNLKVALRKEFEMEAKYINQLTDFYSIVLVGGAWYSMLPMEIAYYLHSFAWNYVNNLVQFYCCYSDKSYNFKPVEMVNRTDSIAQAYKYFKFEDFYRECTLEDQNRVLNENRADWNNFMDARNEVSKLLSGKAKLLYDDGTKRLEKDQLKRLIKQRNYWEDAVEE